MNDRIENEINKTLESLDPGFDIQPGPDFINRVSGKVASIGKPRHLGCQSRVFYPAVILLMLLLNLAAGLVSVKGSGGVSQASAAQLSTLAGEYGIEQNSYANF